MSHWIRLSVINLYCSTDTVQRAHPYSFNPPRAMHCTVCAPMIREKETTRKSPHIRTKLVSCTSEWYYQNYASAFPLMRLYFLQHRTLLLVVRLKRFKLGEDGSHSCFEHFYFILFIYFLFLAAEVATKSFGLMASTSVWIFSYFLVFKQARYLGYGSPVPDQ